MDQFGLHIKHLQMFQFASNYLHVHMGLASKHSQISAPVVG